MNTPTTWRGWTPFSSITACRCMAERTRWKCWKAAARCPRPLTPSPSTAGGRMWAALRWRVFPPVMMCPAAATASGRRMAAKWPLPLTLASAHRWCSRRWRATTWWRWKPTMTRSACTAGRIPTISRCASPVTGAIWTTRPAPRRFWIWCRTAAKNSPCAI